MYSLFDKDCDLVGWIDPNRHIFDTNMNWVAYISGGHAWLAATANWLGPVRGLLCYDTNGRVVAWNPKEHVIGIPRPPRPARAARAARPARPTRPARPPRPARPATPSGGWSYLSFFSWIGQ